MLEEPVETTEDVKDKDPVIDRRPQISQSVGHALLFAVVLAHGELALYKIVEGNIKVKIACLTFTKELILEPKPQVTCDAATFSNDLLKIKENHVGEPAEDDGIHFGPSWVIREGIVRLDVVDEGVSRQGQHNVITPLSIVGGRGVQNDVPEGTNIQHHSHLDV
jgi:hypothetical protein